MPTLTITKNYDDGAALTESMLDDIKTSVETFVNTTKLNSDNIQTGGIATANYAATSVDANALATSAVTTAKINDLAVTTAKIAANAVTGAKLDTAIVDDSTIAISSNQLIVKDGGITQAKRAALGQQVSSSSGAFTTTSTSYVDVTNLSVTITTTGRPVCLMFISDGSGSGNGSIAYVNPTDYADFKILRGATLVSYSAMFGVRTGSVYDVGLLIPSGFLNFVDVVAAGTYTYKLQMKCRVGAGVDLAYTKLVAFEL